MTPNPPDAPAAAPAALTAFLRGIERRGAVFAELATGSRDAGDAALVASMRAFRVLAAQAPFAEWPRKFWSILLATPRLRAAPPDPGWPPAFTVLSTLGSGPRVALLLRLVAGLAEADAAAVLGVARPTYRLALQRALPHRADGTPDAAAWQALAEAAQAAIRRLPPERLSEIARQREAAVLGHKAPPPVRAGKQAHGGAGGWRIAQAGVAVATALALAATWWWPEGDHRQPPPGVAVEPLPPAEAPASTYGADARLLTHRDFDLLLADEDTPAALDPGFHAWYAAQLAATRAGGDAEPLPIRDADAPAANDVVELESTDAPG